MAHTERGTITKDGIMSENGRLMAFTIITIEKNSLPMNVATGRCRKPKGKKTFAFVVKVDGEVLVTVT